MHSRRLLLAIVSMAVVAGCTTLSQGVTTAQRVPDSGPSSSTPRSTLVPGSTAPAGSTVPSGPGSTAGPGTTGSGGASGPQSDDELAARFITDPPDYERVADEDADTGPFDLAEAAQGDGEPDAEAVLRASGFVRGYRRMWLGPADEEINVFLFQHATAEGAQMYFDRTREMVQVAAAGKASRFTVPGLPAGYLGLSGEDGGTARALAVYRTGAFLVQIVCTGSEVEPVRGLLSSLAVEQLRRLG